MMRISVLVVMCAISALGLRYEAPSNCNWKYVDSDFDSVHLECELRTISEDFLSTNFSLTQVEHTRHLTIRCSDVLFFQSSLGERSFSLLRNLESLTIEYCKLRDLPDNVFLGLDKLKSLTLRTHNTEWTPMALELKSGALNGLYSLQMLDLSDNNIWGLPDGVFCSVPNLFSLNLSKNHIQEVEELGFSSASEFGTEDTDCKVDLFSLNLSNNDIMVLPNEGLGKLGNLQELYLQDNDVSLITDDAFAGLTSLRKLNISSNKLVALPPNLFKDCSYIQEIYLRNNSINVLAPGIFQNLQKLVALDLSKNDLTSSWVRGDTFAGLLRLVVLNLSYNQISLVKASVFSDLSSLQVLNMAHNKIDSIEADAFQSLSNLHTLILSNNRLTSLESFHLNGLYVLSSLYLANNHIHNIDRDALLNASNMQDLTLNGNGLIEVPEAIGTLQNLKYLDLGENSIKSIDNASFSGLQQLQGLRLIDNDIGNLTKDSLRDLPALKILNLAQNNIAAIEEGTLAQCTNLKAARLDANRITDMSRILTAADSLLWVNISDNNILWFDYSFLPKKLEWLDIHRNEIGELGNYFELRDEVNLQTIDARQNKITKIGPENIPNSIELLYLNENLISDVAPATFVDKTNLTRVELVRNRLETLDMNAIRINSRFQRKPLPDFYIGENPFRCDCNMEWLQRAHQINGMRQYGHVADAEKITCELHYSRGARTMPFLDVRPEQFLCSYTTHCFALCHCCEFDACDCEMTCPQQCSCLHDATWSTNIVDCSNVGFTRLPLRLPMDATEIYLDGNNLPELSSHVFIGKKNLKWLHLNNSHIQVIHNRTFNGLNRLQGLHLENNKLTEFKGFEFETLSNLRELYLQNNKLRHIERSTFIPLTNIQILDLSGNQLVHFSVWELSINRRLTDISLVGNPWTCSCEYAQTFQNWLLDNSAVVRDAANVTCFFNDTSENGASIAAYNLTCGGMASSVEATVSLEAESYLPVMVVVVCAFVVVLVVTVVVFVCRHNMKLWAHAAYGVRLFQKATPKGEKEKLFDAYLLYNIKDSEFVMQVIAPKLEESEPSYRICLHHRDFSLCTNVMETVQGAAQASRRIVLILSQHFLNDEWANESMRTLLLDVIRNRKTSVITLAIECIPEIILEPDLKLLQKTSTYLHCHEKNFWDRLRFALPDPNVNNYHKNISNYSNGRVLTVNAKNVSRSLDSNLCHTSLRKPTAPDAATPSPTEMTVISLAAPRSGYSELEQSFSSTSSEIYSRLNHSYMSINGDAAAMRPDHIYSTLEPSSTEPNPVPEPPNMLNRPPSVPRTVAAPCMAGHQFNSLQLRAEPHHVSGHHSLLSHHSPHHAIILHPYRTPSQVEIPVHTPHLATSPSYVTLPTLTVVPVHHHSIPADTTEYQSRESVQSCVI